MAQDEISSTDSLVFLLNRLCDRKTVFFHKEGYYSSMPDEPFDQTVVLYTFHGYKEDMLHLRKVLEVLGFTFEDTLIVGRIHLIMRYIPCQCNNEWSIVPSTCTECSADIRVRMIYEQGSPDGYQYCCADNEFHRVTCLTCGGEL